MKESLKNKKGFVLYESLIVIALIIVLNAIMFPSYLKVVDSAETTVDMVNTSEMTKAVERFVAEYTLYCIDIDSGNIVSGQTTGFDAMQGRVYNVVKSTNIKDLKTIEVEDGSFVDNNCIAIYKDTKYPANAKTARAIILNYTIAPNFNFGTKQDGMCFWYAPECRVFVFSKKDSTIEELNKMLPSNTDLYGNTISENTKWFNLSENISLNNS